MLQLFSLSGQRRVSTGAGAGARCERTEKRAKEPLVPRSPRFGSPRRITTIGMAHDPRFPLSEDASGLLYSLGRQPLSHLINIPSSSVTAGTTVEGLLLSNQTIGSPSFVDECTRHHDDVAASLFCQAVINASDAVSLACKRGALLSTGMPLLDEQLGGGLQTGEICEVVGHSCSGKSQLCMAVCAHQLAATDFHVLYIDTSLSFTAERMLQLLRASLAASTSTRDAELKETMKKRLHERLRVCTGAQDLLGLLGTVGALCGEMANEADPSNWYRRLKVWRLFPHSAASHRSILGPVTTQRLHVLRNALC